MDSEGLQGIGASRFAPIAPAQSSAAASPTPLTAAQRDPAGPPQPTKTMTSPAATGQSGTPAGAVKKPTPPSAPSGTSPRGNSAQSAAGESSRQGGGLGCSTSRGRDLIDVRRNPIQGQAQDETRPVAVPSISSALDAAASNASTLVQDLSATPGSVAYEVRHYLKRTTHSRFLIERYMVDGVCRKLGYPHAVEYTGWSGEHDAYCWLVVGSREVHNVVNVQFALLDVAREQAEAEAAARALD